MPLQRALVQAIGLLRLYHDETRALLTVVLPQIAGQPRSHPADATLQQYVGERLGLLRVQLLDDLGGDSAIALHNVSRDGLVTVVGSIGHHVPVVFCGQPCRLGHRLVVVAADTHDTRTVGGNSGLALHANVRMQHDHTLATHGLGGSSQCATVVTISGANHGDATSLLMIVTAQ